MMVMRVDFQFVLSFKVNNKISFFCHGQNLNISDDMRWFWPSFKTTAKKMPFPSKNRLQQLTMLILERMFASYDLHV